jgi:hypothetical protein
MIGFLRPEAVALLRRWQGVAGGVALAALGLYWALALGGILQALGLGLIVAGGALAVQAGIRLRIRTPDTGIGLVEITERELTYFHPQRGASVSLDAVAQVEMRAVAQGQNAPALFWVLHHDDGPPVIVPAGAAGADRLIDAIVAFPGADYGRVIAASRASAPGVFVVWARRPEVAATALPRR